MKTRRPLSINNSLAHGICNYSCRLCAVNKSAYRGPRQFQPAEVTRSLIRRVEEAARSGIHVRYVANAGDGEPTLHPEFVERMGMFGRMLRAWDASVPAPEVSVVTNGSRLTHPGILDAIAGNGLSLIVSFPTPDPVSYGEVMADEPGRGFDLLERVVPGIEAAMKRAAEGRLANLYFHISPPEREIVRRDFPRTLEFLTSRTRAAGLAEICLVMFPATSNRSGLVKNWIGGTDLYRDLFRRWDGRQLNGVTIRMKLVLERFLKGLGEIADLVRAFQFPCLWNANLFIAADGSSICCNDQAVRNPMGNIVEQGIADLMAAKESHQPGRTCAGCDQRPERLHGSPAACLFSLAARVRQALAARPARPASMPAPASSFAYRFGADGRYTARVASGIEDRKKAWALVHKIYLGKGYAKPDPLGLWYGVHDALPETTVLLVEEGGLPVATLTLVFDSPLGLPADQLYGAELNALRSRGRKPCEIVSLASAEGNLRRGAEIMKHIFKLAYLAAVRLQGATDLLITVNPRHVNFYRRTLLMEERGPERRYGKVSGAPAVLLGLDLPTAEARYRQRYGDGEESFFRFFVNPAAEPAILSLLISGRRPLAAAYVRRYFIEDRPLIPALPAYLRHYVEECYPDSRLGLPAGSRAAAGAERGSEVPDKAAEPASVS